jgi:hypothetical protein
MARVSDGESPSDPAGFAGRFADEALGLTISAALTYARLASAS